MRIAFAANRGQGATYKFFVTAVVLARPLSGLCAGITTSIAGAVAQIWCDRMISSVAVGRLIATAAFVVIGCTVALGGGWLQRARRSRTRYR